MLSFDQHKRLSFIKFRFEPGREVNWVRGKYKVIAWSYKRNRNGNQIETNGIKRNSNGNQIVTFLYSCPMEIETELN